MLYSIRDVTLFSVDLDRSQGPVQNSSGRPHERPAGNVFLVARLFSHKHHFGTRCPFPKDSLRPIQIEWASATSRGGSSKFAKIVCLWNNCQT
jgi:hypothetical protein